MEADSDRSVVSCRVMVSFGDGARSVRTLFRGALPYEPAAGDATFDVLLSEQAARFTRLAASGEPLWTIVRRATTRGSTVWDHTQRTVFDLAHEDVMPVSVSPSGTVGVQVRAHGEDTVAELTIDDANTGRVRLVLHLSPRDDVAEHAPALLRLLYGGPSCHVNSGLPLAQLEGLGFLESAATYVGDDDQPISRLVVERVEAVGVTGREFDSPRGFSVSPVYPDSNGQGAPEVRRFNPAVQSPSPETIAISRQALTAEESFTPDCLGSTRYGSMAVLLHQDTLDHASRLVNSVAGLLGTATLAGELSIPWLSDLAAIRGSSAVAPGTGLFCLLRDPRSKPTATHPAGAGGLGLLDQKAVMDLTTPGPDRRSRLQREAATGALLNSMRSWGITSTATIANLFAAGGDLSKVSIPDRVDIAEAYETTTYGTLRVGALPYDEDLDVKDLVHGHLWSLTGAMNFAALGGMPLLSATIGSTGNILTTITVPDTTLSATATWRLDPAFVAASNAVGLATCLLVPFACPAVAVLSTILNSFLLTQLSVIAGSTSSVSVDLDVAFQWDAQRGVVAPSVSVVTTTGAVTLTPTWHAPNVIQVFAETIVTSVGNVLNGWVAALASAIAKALEGGLRGLGIECPLGADGLQLSAVSGMAESWPSSQLTLYAELRPDPGTAGQPFATQVPSGEFVARTLEGCHAAMRSDLTPPPPPSSPIGVYGGLALSQNALNHYVGARWRRRDYQWDTADPGLLAKLVGLAPPATFPRMVSSIHVWSASCPRVEVAQASLEGLGAPLVVFFDDLRVCFEGLGTSNDSPEMPLLELSANVSAEATVRLGDLFAPDLSFHLGSIRVDDQRVWEAADPNMFQATAVPGWAPLVEAVATRLLAGHDAAALASPSAPAPPWRRPLPNTNQQSLFEWSGLGLLPAQDGYLEILGRRRVLYLLPAIRSELIEFVDGSGAPLLNTLLATAAAPVSITTMTCVQGSGLRLDLGFKVPP